MYAMDRKRFCMHSSKMQSIFKKIKQLYSRTRPWTGLVNSSCTFSMFAGVIGACWVKWQMGGNLSKPDWPKSKHSGTTFSGGSSNKFQVKRWSAGRTNWSWSWKPPYEKWGPCWLDWYSMVPLPPILRSISSKIDLKTDLTISSRLLTQIPKQFFFYFRHS